MVSGAICEESIARGSQSSTLPNVVEELSKLFLGELSFRFSHVEVPGNLPINVFRKVRVIE